MASKPPTSAAPPSLQSRPQDSIPSPSSSCLNARGQMRWSAPAVQHLLASHQAAVAAKTRGIGGGDQKLADLLHAEFLRAYPSCPVSPAVLLTKCYIFRSELKSGKLVLGDGSASAGAGTDTDVSVAAATGRQWTAAMLAELEPARQRALVRKRQLGPDCTVALSDFWLGEFRVRFPEYRGSKKNLVKQLRRLKGHQQHGQADLHGGADVEISNEAYEEVKAILESSQVILPPFVSNKVIMRAQQWVEHAAQQQLPVTEPVPAAGNETVEGIPTTVGGQEAAFSILPGGALLITKSSRAGEGMAPESRMVAEAPSVSIIPSTTSSLTVPAPPRAVIIKLSEIGETFF